METNQIRLKIEGFRAVEKADLMLKGITVVAGENGCGKSSLSRFLYVAFKSIIHYDDLVDKWFEERQVSFHHFLNKITSEYFRTFNFSEKFFTNTAQEEPSSNKRLFNFELKFLGRLTKEIKNKDLKKMLERDWIKRINRIEFLYLNKFPSFISDIPNKENRISLFNRFILLFEDVLTQEDLEDIKKLDVSEDTERVLKELFFKLKRKVKSYFQRKETLKIHKESMLFRDNFRTYFIQEYLPLNYELYESGVLILEDQTMMDTYLVEKVAYIETPVSLGLSTTRYWKELNQMLRAKASIKMGNTKLTSILQDDIMKGNAYRDEKNVSKNPFIYHRDDGSEFNLLECATGLKSFAMLQMMLKNGFLDKKTLLIIDEPEAHLHPQWIVEYARMVVLLNKHIGVKFFIASHNPDMVSAIRYISEEEGILEKVDYYLAEKDGDTYQYNYKHLGVDIDPIFGSFNKALDKISEYGVKE